MGRTLRVLAAVQGVAIVVMVVLHLLREESGRTVEPIEEPPRKERETRPAPEQPRVRPSRDRTEGKPTPAEAGQDREPLPGLLVFGRVTDTDGKGIEDVALTFMDVDAEHRYVSTRAGGAYALLGLLPGKWLLHIRAEGCANEVRELELPADVAEHRLDIALTASLRIRVKLLTPDGRPVNEILTNGTLYGDVRARVVATKEHPGQRLPLTESRYLNRGNVGTYLARKNLWRMNDALPKVFDGELFVDTPPPFCVSAVLRCEVIETKEVTEPIEEITFVLTPEQVRSRLASLRVRCVDAETGKPVATKIRISHAQGGGHSATVSKEDGTRVCKDVMPGLMGVEITARGYAEYRRLLDLDPGRETDLGTLRLSKELRVGGVVVDGSGTPVGGGYAVIYDIEQHRDPSRDLDARSSYGISAEGRFVIRSLGPARYLVVVRKGDLRAERVVDTTSGSVTDLRFTMVATTPVIFVPGAGNHGRQLAAVMDDKGTKVSAWRMRGRLPLRKTLLPGSYTLEVYDGKDRLFSRPFTVGATLVRVSLAP